MTITCRNNREREKKREGTKQPRTYYSKIIYKYSNDFGVLGDKSVNIFVFGASVRQHLICVV